MKVLGMRALVAVAAAAATMGFTMAASAASTVIFDRGLPGANWNDTDPLVRSNWSFLASEYSTDVLGDDFAIDGTGQYVIDKVVVWGAQPRGVDLSTLTYSLYMGPSGPVIGDVLTLQSSSGTYQPASYPNGGGSFCGPAGECSLIELTFSGLNYLVNAGEFHDFGVHIDGNVRLHATNAGQAAGAPDPTPQELADGLFFGMVLAGNEATVTDVFETFAPGVAQPVPTDINVQIWATRAAIPEPSSLALLGIALAGLALSRRAKNT